MAGGDKPKEARGICFPHPPHRLALALPSGAPHPLTTEGLTLMLGSPSCPPALLSWTIPDSSMLLTSVQRQLSPQPAAGWEGELTSVPQLIALYPYIRVLSPPLADDDDVTFIWTYVCLSEKLSHWSRSEVMHSHAYMEAECVLWMSYANWVSGSGQRRSP